MNEGRNPMTKKLRKPQRLQNREREANTKTLCLTLFDGSGAGGGTGGSAGAAAGGPDGAADKGADSTKESRGYDGSARGNGPGKSTDKTSVGGREPSSRGGDGRRDAFEKMIKGEYKDVFAERTQKIIDKRFAETRSLEDRFGKLEPVLNRLYARYGVNPGDDDALAAAMEKDSAVKGAQKNESMQAIQPAYLQRRHISENSRINTAVARQQRYEFAARMYDDWVRQGEEAKKVYPGLDLAAECKNKEFTGLLRANVPVKTAYEVIHRDELMGGAMAYTAQQVSKKVAGNILARGARPSENGVAMRSAAISKPDINSLSRRQREEISRRVLRGEKIRF